MFLRRDRVIDHPRWQARLHSAFVHQRTRGDPRRIDRHSAHGRRRLAGATDNARSLPPSVPPKARGPPRAISNAHPVVAGTRLGAAPLNRRPMSDQSRPSRAAAPAGTIENGGATIPYSVFIEAALPPSPLPPARPSPRRCAWETRSDPLRRSGFPLTIPQSRRRVVSRASSSSKPQSAFRGKFRMQRCFARFHC